MKQTEQNTAHVGITDDGFVVVFDPAGNVERKSRIPYWDMLTKKQQKPCCYGTYGAFLSNPMAARIRAAISMTVGSGRSIMRTFNSEPPPDCAG
jgi:hypothetical protein